MQNVSQHLGLGGHQCAWDKPEDLLKVRRVTDLIYRTLGWRAPLFPREFKAMQGVRHSAKLPDLVKKHGSFDQVSGERESVLVCDSESGSGELHDGDRAACMRDA